MMVSFQGMTTVKSRQSILGKTLVKMGWPLVLISTVISAGRVSAETRPIIGPQDKNDVRIVDPEVAALREEALETAIADGNITSFAASCHMGFCFESYYTFTSLERQVDNEQLYSTEVVTYETEMGADEPGRWNFQPAATQVLCSTERPLVIYAENDQYRLDHINPGAVPPNYAVPSHSLYWAVCHDVDTVFELPAETMTEKASELGYSSELEARQTTTPFLELFEG